MMLLVVGYNLISRYVSLFINLNSLSDAQAVMEEKAGKLEHFEGVIKMLTDHKAELTDKVETLTIEKSTSEQEMEDYSTKIKQLRETINSQELSQEDVRRMEREKIRVEEQIAKQNTILEGNVAALKEAQEKWSAIYQLLEQKVEEYNGQARQLELIPKNAKHAKGHTFEVKLDKRKAEDSAVNMMGGVDISGVAKPHVKKLAKGYEGEVLSQKRQLVEVKDQVEDVQRSSERVVDDIEVSLYLLCGFGIVVPSLTYHSVFISLNIPRPLRIKSLHALMNAMQAENGWKMISRARDVNWSLSTLRYPPLMTLMVLNQPLPSLIPSTNSFNYRNKCKRRKMRSRRRSWLMK